MKEWLARVVIGVVGATMVLVLHPPPPVLTQSASSCDPSLVQPPGNPLGYRLRGNRCEGLYVKEVAGTAGLVVASLTDGPVALDPATTKAIDVTWKSPRDAPIRLRAISLRRRLYYRMDTTQSQKGGAFRWPADLLASLRLTGSELGIVGWTTQAIAGQMFDVYVPLKLGDGSTGRAAPRYRLVLLPGAELSEVFVSVLRLTASGDDASVLQRNKPLEYGFYPAERPLTVPLPELVEAGFYRVEIGAVLKRGGSTTQTVMFYRP